MNWVFDNIRLIIFVVIAISVVRKAWAFWKRIEGDAEHRASKRQPAANYDPEEARRVRDIQEEIRRKIAERRGGAQPTSSAPVQPAKENPPYLPPTRTPPLDPFGGPMKKVLVELERRLAPPPVVPESRQAHVAQLERQEQLAEQMRVLEEARVAAERRAAQARVARETESESERGMLTASRGSLLTELHDPRSLRRAFVLREVLSPPVALR